MRHCNILKVGDMSKEPVDWKEMHGSREFYDLLSRAAVLHDKKSHDYASASNPYGNYQFSGMMSKLFTNSDDAGFIGRIGEKIYRLANLENSGKTPKNESIDDTELDIVVITCLWMASRRERRSKQDSFSITNLVKICKSCGARYAQKDSDYCVQCSIAPAGK